VSKGVSDTVGREGGGRKGREEGGEGGKGGEEGEHKHWFLGKNTMKPPNLYKANYRYILLAGSRPSLPPSVRGPNNGLVHEKELFWGYSQ